MVEFIDLLSEFWSYVDEHFWTKGRILGRKRETWILENLRNVECKDHGGSKNTEDSEICRSRQEIFLRNTCWFNFSSFGFDIYGSRRRRRQEGVIQMLRTKKRMTTWLKGVRQVTNTVRRNIGAQNVNYGGQYKHS